MKITVLNGSPKGDTSVTMQYAKYLQKRFPEHEFTFFPVAQQVRALESEREKFDGVMEAVKASDGVLWAFPLYVLAVHANLMRFIELISERGAQGAFEGKYAASLSTSIKFFDHTAHNYMRAVCEDLGMKFTGFFSAAMDDLLEKKNRDAIELFALDFFRTIEKHLPAPRLTARVRAQAEPYTPGAPGETADCGGKKVLLITEHAEPGSNLANMAARLVSAFNGAVETVDLGLASIKGGCLGCLRCGYANECVYGDSDDIRELYNVKIKNADIVVFAAALKGRYFSSRFKTFVDRRFLNTHQPTMTGKQVAYLVSGPLSQNQNVVEIIRANTELDRANLAGIVTDEFGAAQLDGAIDSLAGQLARLCAERYMSPATFLGVGGMKIFRDEVWGPLRFVFRGDHLYYKKHGFYDFPQKQWKIRVQNALMGLLLKVKPVREQVRKELPKHMVEPFKKVMN